MRRIAVLLLALASSCCSAFVIGAGTRPAAALAHGAAVAAPKYARPAYASPLRMMARNKGGGGQRSNAPAGPRKSKKDVLELEGVVLESLPNATFRVQLDDTEQVILAHVSGKIRKNFIKILVGDHVTCEISPYDLTKGRITFRRR